MTELEEEIKGLIQIQNRIYAHRQNHYDHPVVQPGYDRLSEAVKKLSDTIDILRTPMWNRRKT